MVKPSDKKPAKRGAGSDKRTPETIDGETGKPEDTPRRIDLSNLRDIRLEMAHVYRQVDAGKIESQDGSRRAYMLKTIHDVIVSAELERRIQELEDRQNPPARGIGYSGEATTH